MWYTNIYSNIIVYQNIKGHPLKYGMLRAVGTRVQVQRLKESRLTIRGDGDQAFFNSDESHIVPTTVLVRVQRLRDDLYKAEKGQAQDI